MAPALIWECGLYLCFPNCFLNHQHLSLRPLTFLLSLGGLQPYLTCRLDFWMLSDNIITSITNIQGAKLHAVQCLVCVVKSVIQFAMCCITSGWAACLALQCCCCCCCYHREKCHLSFHNKVGTVGGGLDAGIAHKLLTLALCHPRQAEVASCQPACVLNDFTTTHINSIVSYKKIFKTCFQYTHGFPGA